jgi:hypothetical protein
LIRNVNTALLRSHNNIDHLELGIVGVVCVTTLSLILGGYGEYGALLIAVSAGLFVLAKTGAFRTRYQRMVTDLLRPIDRTSVRAKESDRDLDVEVRRLCAVKPPPVARTTHDDVVRAMQSLAEGRSTLSISVDMVSDWNGALQELERVSSGLSSNVTDPGDPNLTKYVVNVDQIITAFKTKQNEIATQNYENMRMAIGKLRSAVPPSRHALAHNELIEGLERMNNLSREQHRHQYDGDWEGVVRTAQELKKSRDVTRGAIRQIMRWY